ncbi:MAG: deoxyribonuclease IV [Chthoniobacterales bacterium]
MVKDFSAPPQIRKKIASGLRRKRSLADGSRQSARGQSAIRTPKSAILLGAHMSIGGGVHMAIERARSIDCTAMQIFVKNNMQWFARPLTTTEITAFLKHSQRKELGVAFAHANYLINLAATNPQFHFNSMRALGEELIRADQLRLPFLVVHPGAHLGAGEEGGLNAIVASIDQVLAAIPKVKTKIALETTAGQGSCLGCTFEHIEYILANVREPERLCVCLDTAHVFAAGYDIGTEKGVRKVFGEFDRIIGLNRLSAIHLNDSKTARGSRVDRHEHIGKGEIGLAAFQFIMRNPQLRKIPKVLETPKGKDLKEDVENLRVLQGLL